MQHIPYFKSIQTQPKRNYKLPEGQKKKWIYILKGTCVKQPQTLLLDINFVSGIELTNMVLATNKKSGDFVDFG